MPSSLVHGACRMEMDGAPGGDRPAAVFWRMLTSILVWAMGLGSANVLMLSDRLFR